MNVKPNDVRPVLVCLRINRQCHHNGCDSDVDKDYTNDDRTDKKDEIEDIYQSQTHCITVIQIGKEVFPPFSNLYKSYATEQN